MTERGRNVLQVYGMLSVIASNYSVVVGIYIYIYTHTHTHTVNTPYFSPDTIITSVIKYIVGRVSSVGISGPGDRIPVWARFSAPVQTGSGARKSKRYRVFAGAKGTEEWH